MSARAAKNDVATREQLKAADPAVSAWVSASAGSGKTFVLARRVLRLLRAGVPPGRILCLTFTRAAAAEMTNRVFAELGKWATMSDKDLATEILRLEGGEPGPEDLARARRLFATALETPGGLKIQTIHAFAERVLHRFPFEANVAAHFEVLDAQEANEIRDAAIASVLAAAGCEADGVLARALDRIAAYTGETRFADVLGAVLAKREHLRRWVVEKGDMDRALADLAAALGAEPGVEPEALAEGICASPHFPIADWASAIDLFQQGSTNDQKQARRLAKALAGKDEARRENYLAVFQTGTGTMRARLMTKAVAEEHPGLADRLEKEQARLEALIDRMRAQETWAASAALMRIADAVLDRYEARKRARGLLDYDDLIARTLNLLTHVGAAEWVLYKLDGGIDHILIDEAQDTNPQQWEIVRRLAEEGMSGEGGARTHRTLFAVGDEKQSIYSFQGADPVKFDEMRRYFERRVRDAGKGWEGVPLNLSFRSGPAVLEAVDRVFASPAAREGLDAAATPVVHTPHRKDAPGLVELWPTEKAAETEQPDHWAAPLDRIDAESPRTRLARRIAATIARWRDEKTILEAEGRPIDPGDILVLVRRRNDFVDSLVGALRDAGVPVAGADRLVLQEHIAVMDLLVAADVVLLPEDDLALATLLKSPLVGIGEDELMELAAAREGSLIDALSARAGEAAFAPAHAFVARLRAIADYAPPFAFFSEILGPLKGCERLLARLGPEAADALSEFLDLALRYEHANVPSLQGFVQAVRAGRADISRNMDQTRGEVRIMTVHGAKGLEAPIVFLPDTCDVPDGRFDGPLIALPPASPDAVPPLAWTVGSQNTQPAAVEAAREAARAQQMAEYRRLLYVAMTRACDRLYICGAQSRTNLPEGCWYELMETALGAALEPVTDAGGATVAWRFTRGDEGSVGKKAQGARDETETRVPDWARQDAPPPEPAERVLVPSRAGEAETVGAQAPEKADGGLDARKRGNLIHALLERLPDIAPQERGQAAARLIAALAPDLAEVEADAIANETLGILDLEELAPLFGPASRAEVALGGRIATGSDGVPVAITGQIDRLAITGTAVLIADYKTGRDIPPSAEQTPDAYVSQLALYRAALASIHPGKEIRAFIVWTAGPAVMEVPAANLERAAARILTGARSRGNDDNAP